MDSQALCGERRPHSQVVLLQRATLHTKARNADSGFKGQSPSMLRNNRLVNMSNRVSNTCRLFLRV
jgi:hypothetical protein